MSFAASSASASAIVPASPAAAAAPSAATAGFVNGHHSGNSSSSIGSQPFTSGFSGRWAPLTGSTLSAPAASVDRAEMASWHSLALGILKLHPKTLQSIEQDDSMRIVHNQHTLAITHQPASAAAAESPSAAAVPPSATLTLQLDNRPHTFLTGQAPTASNLTITACQLPAGPPDDSDLLIKIDFAPEHKGGGRGSARTPRKFVSFQEEQVALHRAGYVLERSHLSERDRMTQVVQYHRASASMSDEVVAMLDAAHLPVVYSITRSFARVDEPAVTPQAGRRLGAVFPRSASGQSSTPRGSIAPASPSPSSSRGALAHNPFASSPSTPFCTLTGLWRVDRTRGDTLEAMLKDLGVNWVARKVILGLEVSTRIAHDPSSRRCTITDSSSAGEQSTEHVLSGEWREVASKEGKVIKMRAREGDDLRAEGVWQDQVAAVAAGSGWPFALLPSSTPFPASFPRPYAWSERKHPLSGGYLWIHTILPDPADGSAQMMDIRCLVERDVMVQQSVIVRAGKVSSNTTRFFTKVESEPEKSMAELEWGQKIEEWNRRHRKAPPPKEEKAAEDRGGAASPTESDSDADNSLHSRASSSLSLSSTSSSLLLGSPPPALSLSSSSSGSLHTNLSGVWSVVKERSNDLSVLLKRMGVPWVYRAFAGAETKTTIVHTPALLSLKDASAFGKHEQSFVVDGEWHEVEQYGKQRRGLCRVTSDPRANSVSVETVYFAPSKGGAAGGGGKTPSSAAPTPRDIVKQGRSESRDFGGGQSDALLTMDSQHQSPMAARPGRFHSTDESLLSHASAAEESKAAHSRHSSGSAGSDSDSEDAAPAVMEDVSLAEDFAYAASLAAPIARPGFPRAPMFVHVPSPSLTPALSTAASPMRSQPSTPSLQPLNSSSSFALPPGYTSMPTSRVVDIRSLASHDLMRQMITYLEYEVVVCVCSRLYRRELSKAEKAAAEEARKDAEKRKWEQGRKDAEERAREKRNAEARRSNGGGGNGAPYGASPGPSGRQQSAATPMPPSSASVRVALSAAAPAPAPAPVLSPTAAAAASPPNSWPTLTAPRAAVLFLVLIACVSAQAIVSIVLLACAAAYALRGQWMRSGSVEEKAPMLPQPIKLRSPEPVKERVPTIPLGPGLEVSVVPLRR